jgi:DNA-binding NtrC family response regulator
MTRECPAGVTTVPSSSSSLHTLIDEAREVCQDLDATSQMRVSASLGLSAGHFIEASYRLELGVGSALSIEGYAELIARIDDPAGGRFSVAIAADRSAVLSCTRCPFNDWRSFSPFLCQMAVSAFGTIAARNFGYAKVEFARRMVSSDRCEICVHTDPRRGGRRHGEEYREAEGRILRQPAPSGGAVPGLWDRVEPECQPRGHAAHGAVIAESAAMQRVLRMVEMIAPTQATTLMSGETGVGKELIARRLHAHSLRARRPFIAVNCGAIPETLIESTLFGHERGAFTGAHEAHPGLFERAEQGTLFLDELDSLSLGAQTRLLRVLQEAEYERVGGRRTLKTDVRIIAATNCQLDDAVKQGRFRRDLYYRVNVVHLAIPPLRERPEDIQPLVGHILERLCSRHGKRVDSVSRQVMDALLAYPWPGNIRELENVLERSFLFCRGAQIQEVALTVGAAEDARRSCALIEKPWREHRRDAAGEVEKRFLADALTRHTGNVTKVAELMNLTKRAVYLKLRAHGIDLNSYRG